MKPVLALTIGEPAGIGPEISLRAALAQSVNETCRPILIGDRVVIEAIAARLKIAPRFKFFQREELESTLSRDPEPGTVEFLDTDTITEPPTLSLPSREGGVASYAAIVTAIDEATAGRFHGVVTAPINKLSLSLADIKFPGHTEIFGERTKSPHYAMMMYSERLAVGLVTCHQSLTSVPASLTVERIAEVGRLLAGAVERLRGRKPRMAVLGLNPHAGESGLFGDEERRFVSPAIRLLQAEGFDVEGPLPPDTAFAPAIRSRFDAHLCLYHDQGLIPFKMISFEDGVNVTMGLPFVRTSVDHGTAFDIAGLGVAGIGSLLEAIKLAVGLTSGPPGA